PCLLVDQVSVESQYARDAHYIGLVHCSLFLRRARRRADSLLALSEILPTSILVLGIVAAMSLLAQRLAGPEPVLLALAGMRWSRAPALPGLEIPPQLILGFLLPPLLYAEAWEASWIDFRRWLRSILQLAIGLVAFTILVVGLVAQRAMPELPLA